MKYFVVSDLHGHFDELMKALNGRFDETNKNHKLIVAGDLFDRGTQNIKVFHYVYRLYQEDKAIIIKGNHDLFFNDLMSERYDHVLFNMDHNGFGNTLKEFAPSCETLEEIKQAIKIQYPHLIQFLNELPYFFETQNFIITHAGLDLSNNGNWKQGNWQKAVWTKTEAFFEQDLKQFGIHKTVVVGHRFASKLRKHFTGKESDDLYVHHDGQKIAIDRGVVLSKQINVFEFEE